jgi:hypothetical protein
MIQFDISNIRDLFGPSVSIKKVKDSGIYCLWVELIIYRYWNN